jgi:uncharacterized protein DUF4291
VKLPTERYRDQVARWPTEGRHILAHYDADSIVVYQAYRPSIGEYAIRHRKFGVDFSYTRMSWIKPNFLWMMYRSGWGTKEGQGITLGLRLRREFFDSILAQAVASRLNQSDQPSQEEWDEWRASLPCSNVRLQWDPDHHPHGNPLARRAIQLGLRGPVLEDFGKREFIEVIDMTEFVSEQRALLSGVGVGELRTPVERVYVPDDVAIARRLKLDRTPAPPSV